MAEPEQDEQGDAVWPLKCAERLVELYREMPPNFIYRRTSSAYAKEHWKVRWWRYTDASCLQRNGGSGPIN